MMHYVKKCTNTAKRFRLLQTYFGHLSCIPFVCITREVQGLLTIRKRLVEKLPSFSVSFQILSGEVSFFYITNLPLDSSLVAWL